MSNECSRKKLCVSSLVLGIVGLVFSLFLPVVSYSCAIPGLVIGLKKRKKNYSASAGIVLSIIAIAISLINSVLGIIMTVKLFFSEKEKDEEEKEIE